MLPFYLSLIDSEEEKDKFEKVYLCYRKRMWLAAYKILNDEFEAEDAVQIAFIGIAKNISQIETVDSPVTLAYVTKAAKNAALRLSTKSFKKFYNIDDFSDKCFFESISDFEKAENAELIERTLKKMPEKYRHLLYLKYGLEKDNSEIAKELDISKDSLRMQLSRARKCFVETFKKESETVEQ